MLNPLSFRLSVLWRTKLRSTVSGIDPAEQVIHYVDAASSASVGESTTDPPTALPRGVS
ncbi:MAG: hypothetical protein M3370_02105 [Actinomycetota bacterium]|nr:hypothetical protein [Actinomycetota bacterium]